MSPWAGYPRVGSGQVLSLGLNHVFWSWCWAVHHSGRLLQTSVHSGSSQIGPFQARDHETFPALGWRRCPVSISWLRGHQLVLLSRSAAVASPGSLHFLQPHPHLLVPRGPTRAASVTIRSGGAGHGCAFQVHLEVARQPPIFSSDNNSALGVGLCLG